jgi:hypothetical protein
LVHLLVRVTGVGTRSPEPMNTRGTGGGMEHGMGRGSRDTGRGVAGQGGEGEGGTQGDPSPLWGPPLSNPLLTSGQAAHRASAVDRCAAPCRQPGTEGPRRGLGCATVCRGMGREGVWGEGLREQVQRWETRHRGGGENARPRVLGDGRAEYTGGGTAPYPRPEERAAARSLPTPHGSDHAPPSAQPRHPSLHDRCYTTDPTREGTHGPQPMGRG